MINVNNPMHCASFREILRKSVETAHPDVQLHSHCFAGDPEGLNAGSPIEDVGFNKALTCGPRSLKRGSTRFEHFIISRAKIMATKGLSGNEIAIICRIGLD